MHTMTDHAELTKRFRAVATKFIEVVDSAPQLEREAFLASIGLSMVELYNVALSLPPVKRDTNGSGEPSFPADKEDELHRSLKEKIGTIDAYWEVFDTTEKQEPVQSSLAGDISEIYFDLKQSFRREKTGTSKSDLWPASELSEYLLRVATSGQPAFGLSTSP